jgi:general secretion pathway protein E/type IV pilus assembly protein PilB
MRLKGPVISRVKLLAGMDIAEKRLPQDGHIKSDVGGKNIDLRVSTLPAFYGESVVLRILDKSSVLIGLGELGFSAEDRKVFERLIEMPNGIILVTGPTGSGKTTTLYACLNTINRPDRKLITVEDPVEYQLEGINQVQVKPLIGLTFAAGLRHILRQAPDVIMVGEIRDKETADIAITAALTGHLVFSTLHTNDAAGAVTRLIDMGMKPFLVASSVQAIMAQRLVRTICPKCKEPYQPNLAGLKEVGLLSKDLSRNTFYQGKGCSECQHTGYKGRIGIFELLLVNDVIREMILSRCSSTQIKEKAMELGMKTLRQDGLIKAMQGLTTITEVARVTQADVEELET